MGIDSPFMPDATDKRGISAFIVSAYGTKYKELDGVWTDDSQRKKSETFLQKGLAISK